jgi:hypothetical protein
MKPSRPTSNGRHALSGSSLRRLSANMAEKPAMPIGVIVASAPPQTMTSTSPLRSHSTASPIECALEAQALVWQ